MTRTSGQHASSQYGDLAHDCGHDGYALWVHDPEVDPYTVVAECPGCGVEIERPTSEGIF